MKHFVQPRNAILRENHTSEVSSPNPSSVKQRSSSRKNKGSKENAPPADLNAILDSPALASGKPSPATMKMKSPLPPRPPSSNSLKRKFTIESVPENGVLGSSDSGVKLEIFQLVGAPLVENCLAGFNSSVFAYGQTGSGKTYTMWGPANALLEENLSSDQQGLTPRVFERLFARINEIYNEQITDLLDPSQRNLQRTADGLSSFKTSRINLVDLAGSERQKLTGAAGERLKEAGNINRSLSQLGNLINILAEVSQTGKQRHIPYRDSRLTFLLQESLGGNAKLAMVCAVSPAQSCKSETLSTLRFAQRAKAIKNKAIVNEVMQDDVNFLREDELLRMKANANQTDPNGGYSTGWNARRSLNLLKFSLNRPMTLPHVDEDSDEEMEIVDECEQKLNSRTRMILPLRKEILGSLSQTPLKVLVLNIQGSKDIDVIMDEEPFDQVDNNHEGITVGHREPFTNTPHYSEADATEHHNHTEGNDKDSSRQPSQEHLNSSVSNLLNEESPSKQMGDDVVKDMSYTTPNGSGNHVSPSNLNLVPCEVSPILKSPTPSVSPRVNSSRKSLRTSSILTHSEKDMMDDDKLASEAKRISFVKTSKSSCLNSQTTRTSRSCFPPTENLAASIQHGLEIIDSHWQSSTLRRSQFRFSYKPADVKPILPIDKVDVGVQTFPEDELQEEDSLVLLCSKCRSGNSQQEPKDANDTSNMQLVPVDGSQLVEKSKMLVPKAVEKVLAGAIRREMALEEFSAKQTSEIMHLNRLVQQYKHERECNAIIGQTREDKIIRLESLMDGTLTAEEFMEEELASLKNEHELLNRKYENHPEVMRTKIELKRIQDELERYRNFFDMGERDVLLEEIQDLRSQLQYYVDTSPNLARKRRSLLQLTYSCEPSAPPPLCTIPESTEESLEQKLEQERICWMEAESKSRNWIQKRNAQKELKEAMQMAMQGHARMLEQYADLEEKHIQLLARHRKIQDGIDDVKKAASKAGVRGAESKFINALAAEISALKAEREKERRYFRDENKGLQAQLRDTADAVQAAGELLVRLKEADEAVAAAEKRAMEAEQEAVKAYKQIDKLKKKHEKEIISLNQLIAESRLPKEAIRPVYDDSDVVKYDAGESPNTDEKRWREEFEPFYNAEEGELSKLAVPSSWFSGYDRCNI
ncbi:phragmoplast-associated kinesin-related protein [Actinidia rufa]|uniref:Phragmoplast-associated kinesin-related protein n=1 Tax=Actinidia rufa TaxID=165716 RepID=A0A7J0EAZ0_9ERIC|nr:phragmoplast-associated kinesin-related protein [Actinidia rufa]